MAALSLPHPLPTRHACEVPSVLQALCEKLRALQRGSRLPRPSQGGSRPSTHSGVCQLRPGSHLRTHQRPPQTLSALPLVCCTPSFPRPSARLCPSVPLSPLGLPAQSGDCRRPCGALTPGPAEGAEAGGCQGPQAPGPSCSEKCAQAWKPSSQHAGEKRGVAGLLLGRTERAARAAELQLCAQER